jgi:hypothetical protein
MSICIARQGESYYNVTGNCDWGGYIIRHQVVCVGYI